MATVVEARDALSPPARGAAYILLLLFLANLLNMGDRALLGIVVDPVKADLLLTDTQMSIVSGTAFILFNLLVGIFIAGWVDRGNRKWILILGVSLWSAATAMTGLAQGFWSLALTRILVGVGEATAFPVAISMLSDLYNAPKRPRAISIFHSSTFIGIVAGSILAGVLAAAHGWRAMFVICGVAGFVLVAMMVLTMREPVRTDDGDHPLEKPANQFFQSIGELLRLRGFIPLSLGMAFASMSVTVLPTWAPAFLLRSHDVPLASVGALIGPAVGLGGITGTIFAGMLATYLVRKHKADVYGLMVPLIAVPLATPFFLIFLFEPVLVLAMSAAAVMNFLLASALATCIAVAISIAPSNMRAMSSTLMLIASSIIGGALAPFIVGAASDFLVPTFGVDSLRYGLATMAPTPLLAGAMIWWAFVQIRVKQK